MDPWEGKRRDPSSLSERIAEGSGTSGLTGMEAFGIIPVVSDTIMVVK